MERFSPVKVWEEKVVIPTYKVGQPDKNPMFLEKRVYQGSSGKVYPHPVIDKIGDEKESVEYRAVFIENDFIKVMLLPEIGGRIQRATDKTNGYDFVYYNHVIKPALVGLAGPWISGGIEFNWPQHHRPSTFDPVDCIYRENSDGSATVIMSEIENMFRTKGSAAFTLYPHKAYIEINAHLYNRTDLPQTFLWWANPAVAVNDNTRSIFPPDVTAVMDHGKRAVSSFPIATGTYYKVDYSRGVDISRYKNLPVPTSYMAAKSDYDFVGGYDDGVRGGILHVADHHVSPGKKQWTWGCGDFGKAWDRNLTDSDGPYIELMTGCFTDNQPDFSWLAPMEEKSFTQYFMPYKNIGTVHNANKDMAMCYEDGAVRIYSSGAEGDFEVTALGGDCVIFCEKATLTPGCVWEKEVPKSGQAEEIQILKNGKIFLNYKVNGKKQELPSAALCPPDPKDCETTEDLYLYGLHIEQYRHATYLAEDYYLEGLRRDPTDIRLNNAYGLLLLRRGLFTDSEKYFKKAIEKATRSNPNPYDSEPYYNLGLALLYDGRLSESYDAFYKAAWSKPCQEAAYYHLSCISMLQGRVNEALEHIENAIIKNGRSFKALNLKALLLMETGREDEGRQLAKEIAALDPTDIISRRTLGEKPGLNRDTAVEIAAEYGAAGFFDLAIEVLDENESDFPLNFYYRAYYYGRLGNREKQMEMLKRAKNANSYLCFPHRIEDIFALKAAIAADKTDGMGHYYLGCLYYDKRRYDDAIALWQQCAELLPKFPTAHRNLALALYNKRNDAQGAAAELEKAFQLDPLDGRVLMELDLLYKKMQKAPNERLAFLAEHMALTESRDDLYTEYVTLLNLCRQPEKALNCTLPRHFHPWEGGEGKITAQYVASLCYIGKKNIDSGDFSGAVETIKKTFSYPHNLGEGKLYGAKENLQYYLLGKAYKGMGKDGEAEQCFREASLGLSEPQSAMYYNDQPPESIFCQGAALMELGMEQEGQERFKSLISYGDKHMNDNVRIDYFAVSLPDFLVFDNDLDKQNKAHCLFMQALGYLGLGDKGRADELFAALRDIDNSHWAMNLYYTIFME